MEQSEDDRTTSVGLFNFATSCHEGARALGKVDFRATHRDSPIAFLYVHSIELFLKAFLSMHGHSVAELRSRDFGHSYRRLRERSIELGLQFLDEDLDVFARMEQTDFPMRTRYLRTGYYMIPTIEALERTTASIREAVGDELRKHGIKVRN